MHGVEESAAVRLEALAYGVLAGGRVWRQPALVHKDAQSIEFIMFFDLTQKNVTCGFR
jgi:hypothetical protein